jgi:hypothetical protein
MTEPRHNEHNEGAGFERQDLGSRPVYGFLISLVVIGVLVYYAVWGIFYALETYNSKHQPATNPMVQQTTTSTRTVEPGAIEKAFPEPRLETNERGEINDFRLGEEQTLNSYGWVDQSSGVVRIPITEAMKLVAERGLSTKPATGTVPQSPVNLSQAAAAASDTSNMPAKPASTKKKGEQQ